MFLGPSRLVAAAVTAFFLSSLSEPARLCASLFIHRGERIRSSSSRRIYESQSPFPLSLAYILCLSVSLCAPARIGSVIFIPLLILRAASEIVKHAYDLYRSLVRLRFFDVADVADYNVS